MARNVAVFTDSEHRKGMRENENQANGSKR